MNRERTRVLQLVDHMGSGGAQRIVYDLARLLPDLDVDVEVAHLYAPNVFAAELSELGVPIHDLSTGGSYQPVAALDPRPPWRLRHLLRARPFDVVHAHLYIAPLHLRFARLLGSPRSAVVNTVHAHDAHLPRYVYPAYRVTRAMTDVMACDFVSSVRDFERMGGFARVDHVPFGVDPIDAGSGAGDLRRELGIRAGDVALLSVARLHPQRNIAEMIEAFAGNSARHRCHFLVVGDGPDESRLRALAAAYGIDERTHFLGRRADLASLFAAADLYLTMSVGGDVGIAALQAASAGLPVLAWDILDTRVPANATSRHQPCATSPAAAFSTDLDALIQDASLRESLGASGRRAVCEEFTAGRMAERYASLYDDLTGVGRASVGPELRHGASEGDADIAHQHKE